MGETSTSRAVMYLLIIDAAGALRSREHLLGGAAPSAEDETIWHLRSSCAFTLRIVPLLSQAYASQRLVELIKTPEQGSEESNGEHVQPRAWQRPWESISNKDVDRLLVVPPRPSAASTLGGSLSVSCGKCSSAQSVPSLPRPI